MMHIRVDYGERSHVQVLYDIWDVNPAHIVLPRECVSEDAGKFLLFTDGSRMLTRIFAKCHRYIVTENGLFYTNDYVTQCVPKTKGTMYSGLFFHDESLHLHPPTKKELAVYRDYFNGIMPAKSVSKRVEMLILSKIRDEMKDQGIDEEWIIDRLKSEATNKKNRGADRLQAVTMLARAGGVEIGAVQSSKLPQLPFFSVPGIPHPAESKRVDARQVTVIDVISTVKPESVEVAGEDEQDIPVR